MTYAPNRNTAGRRRTLTHRQDPQVEIPSMPVPVAADLDDVGVGNSSARSPYVRDAECVPATPRVVFVFADVDLNMFPSIADAQDWMEAIDVDDGEYTAALTETGRVLKMRTDNGLVVLEMTDELDPDLLQRLLREHGQAIGQPGIEQDPVGFANQTWKLEWEQRWPRWPRWLDNRLHPHGAVQA